MPRATAAPSCAISGALFALLLSGTLGMAQTAPATSTATAQASALQTPAATPAGRVGSLSPDEQRRAIRGRERAAAAEKAAREARERTEAKTAEMQAKSAETADGRTAAKVAAAPAGEGASRDVARKAPPQDPPVQAAQDEASAAVTHRSVAVAAPERADASNVAAPRLRHVARLRKTRRSRFAAGDPRVGDRVPADATLLPLPPGFIRRGLPYQRYAEDVRPTVPLGSAYAPPYPYYRQGW